MAKESGKVNIHGKEYETVASRVQRFREENKYSYSLETEIVANDGDVVVMKALMRDTEGRIIATGHAEEKRGASQINRTSALENAETSALGRCLANAGYGGTEFASADEVANAIHQQSKPAAQPKPAISKPAANYNADGGEQALTGKKVSPSQGKLLLARARDFSGLQDWDEIRTWFVDTVGTQPNDVLMSEMDDVLAVLEQARQS